MTDVSAAANVPIEIEVGGKKLKARELTLKEIFGHFEGKVKSEKMADLKAMAAIIDDEEERRQLLSDGALKLPSGTELTKLAAQSMGAIHGIIDLLYMAVKDNHPELTLDDVQDLVSAKKSDVEYVESIIAVLTGITFTRGGSEKNEEAATEESSSQ